MTNTNYAMKRTMDRKVPSVDKSNVERWIIWPAIFAFFCGGAMGAGAGLAFLSWLTEVDWRFVVGMGASMAGMMGLAGIALKSFSFDKTGETKHTVDEPIFYSAEVVKVNQQMGGNGAVSTPSRMPHIVKHKGQTHNFTQDQMIHMSNRYFGDKADYRITRDKGNTKMFQEWDKVKTIMIGLELWHEDDKGGIYWTVPGGVWFEEHHRMAVSPH